MDYRVDIFGDYYLFPKDEQCLINRFDQWHSEMQRLEKGEVLTTGSATKDTFKEHIIFPPSSPVAALMKDLWGNLYAVETEEDMEKLKLLVKEQTAYGYYSPNITKLGLHTLAELLVEKVVDPAMNSFWARHLVSKPKDECQTS
ncbi:MAG: hypothetical protein KDH96_08200 [Candidatus Riesia sp.]|nr:hypothetical protein [Candidatus Riesia sp.]